MTAFRSVCGRIENACVFLGSRNPTDFKERRCGHVHLENDIQLCWWEIFAWSSL